jgi:hypothetical protein
MIQCVRHGSCKRSIGRCNCSFPCSLSRSCSRTSGTMSTRPMRRTGCLSWHVAGLCRAAPTHAGSAGCRMQRLSLSHMLTSGLSLQLSGAGEPRNLGAGVEREGHGARRARPPNPSPAGRSSTSRNAVALVAAPIEDARVRAFHPGSACAASRTSSFSLRRLLSIISCPPGQSLVIRPLYSWSCQRITRRQPR